MTDTDEERLAKQERVFVYGDLAQMLGEDGVRKLAIALAASLKRTALHEGAREEVRLVCQNERVVEIVPHQERWKVLPPPKRP